MATCPWCAWWAQAGMASPPSSTKRGPLGRWCTPQKSPDMVALIDLWTCLVPFNSHFPYVWQLKGCFYLIFWLSAQAHKINCHDSSAHPQLEIKGPCSWRYNKTGVQGPGAECYSTMIVIKKQEKRVWTRKWPWIAQRPKSCSQPGT